MSSARVPPDAARLTFSLADAIVMKKALALASFLQGKSDEELAQRPQRNLRACLREKPCEKLTV